VTGRFHTNHGLASVAVAVERGEEVLIAGGIVVKAQVGDQSALVVHQGRHMEAFGYVNTDVDSHWRLLSVWDW